MRCYDFTNFPWSILCQPEIDQDCARFLVFGFEVFRRPGAVAVHVFDLALLEISLPRIGLDQLAEHVVPVSDLRARHAARTYDAAPDFMGAVDAQLFPRRHVSKFAMRALRCR